MSGCYSLAMMLCQGVDCGDIQAGQQIAGGDYRHGSK